MPRNIPGTCSNDRWWVAATVLGLLWFGPQSAMAQFSAVSLSPSTAYEQTTLTCSPVGGSSNVVAYSYKWTILPSPATPPDTLRTLTGQHFSKNNQVKCSIKAYDAAGWDFNMGYKSSSSVIILNTLPHVGPPTISPSPALTTSTLRCTANHYGDADGDNVTILYGWKVNGVPAFEDTLQTLAPGRFHAGDTVVCGAVISDGSSSTPLLPIIGWSAPTIPVTKRVTVTAVAEDGGTASVMTNSKYAACRRDACEVDIGSDITLNATPIPGYAWAAWSGECARSTTAKVTLRATTTHKCIASFRLVQ